MAKCETYALPQVANMQEVNRMLEKLETDGECEREVEEVTTCRFCRFWMKGHSVMLPEFHMEAEEYGEPMEHAPCANCGDVFNSGTACYPLYPANGHCYHYQEEWGSDRYWRSIGDWEPTAEGFAQLEELMQGMEWDAKERRAYEETEAELMHWGR